MSQVYKSLNSGNIPSNIPTSFVTQSGTAVPAANILIVNAYDTSENNDNGIETKGGVAGGDPPGTGLANETDIYLTNRVTGTVTTTTDAITPIITLTMFATPGTYHVWGDVVAYDTVNAFSGAYSFSGGYRTNGIVSTELSTEFHDTFEDVAFVLTDIFLSASGPGNNIVLSVQGLPVAPPNSINWNAKMEFRRVS